MISEKTLNDKNRGCLMAGAAGDALGYEVEYVFAHAFDWAATPEGRDYWRELDKEWCGLVRDK